MANIDRTLIAGIMLPHFPSMEGATSDEWHGFLNTETGLNVPLNEPNNSAFDSWRMALADRFPVWGISAEKAAEIKQRGITLKALEDERVANLAVELEKARLEAPAVTVADLIA